jgi:hypothetical protein
VNECSWAFSFTDCYFARMTQLAKEDNLFKSATERSLPSSLFWVTQPFKWVFDSQHRLCIVASPQTNLYNPVGTSGNVQAIESACFIASKRTGAIAIPTQK